MPPIDDLYADSTSAFLTGSNQVNVPTPRATPSTGITSIASAVARGLGQGGASLFGAAADTASGLSQLYVDPDSLAGNPDALQAADQQVNAALAKARAGHLFESNIGTSAYDLADTLKADPTKTTTVDQVVQGAVSGLTQIVPAAVLGGPLAGAAVGGLSMGQQRAEDLKRQGVDVGTRTAVGAVEGAIGVAGAVLPVGGPSFLTTAGLVGIGGPGLAVLQGSAERSILRNANYDGLADQIDPLDPVNLAASTIMAGVFGGAHTIGAVRAARADAAAAAAPSTSLADMSVAARKALPYNAPALDAYATQVAQREGERAPSVPDDQSIALDATAPAATAESAPISRLPDQITRESLAENGSVNIRKASAALEQRVRAALLEGRDVTLHSDGAQHRIVGFENGMVDSAGKRWTTMDLLKPPGEGEAPRVELGEPPQAATAAGALVESNLRQAAADNPDRRVTLDAPSAGSDFSSANPRTAAFDGPLQDALDLIDREHAETVAGGKLFRVAAQCFLSLGG